MKRLEFRFFLLITIVICSIAIVGCREKTQSVVKNTKTSNSPELGVAVYPGAAQEGDIVQEVKEQVVDGEWAGYYQWRVKGTFLSSDTFEPISRYYLSNVNDAIVIGGSNDMGKAIYFEEGNTPIPWNERVQDSGIPYKGKAMFQWVLDYETGGRDGTRASVMVESTNGGTMITIERFYYAK